MARSHAKITTAVWRDPAWTRLTARAQWLYMLLLSQQSLSLVGSLDTTPGKWATLANGVTREAIDVALAELEEHRFVVLDHDTGELLIRSFTRHDIDPNRVNMNLAKGLWGQWGCIASPGLRSVALHEMPAAVWDKLEPHAPPDAAHIRRSARLEPATAAPVGDRESGPGWQPPLSSHLPPVTTHRPAGPPPVDLDPPPIERIPQDHVDLAREHLARLRAVRTNPQGGSESGTGPAAGPPSDETRATA